VKGEDGLVFVADSRQSDWDAEIEKTMKNLHEHLKEQT